MRHAAAISLSAPRGRRRQAEAAAEAAVEIGQVVEAATEGDEVASRIVQHEATELACTAASAVKNNGLQAIGIPLALAGGVMLGSETYRNFFLAALQHNGVQPGATQLVPDPAIGAVVLARRLG